jgi:hypothetical protein
MVLLIFLLFLASLSCMFIASILSLVAPVIVTRESFAAPTVAARTYAERHTDLAINHSSKEPWLSGGLDVDVLINRDALSLYILVEHESVWHAALVQRVMELTFVKRDEMDDKRYTVSESRQATRRIECREAISRYSLVFA